MEIPLKEGFTIRQFRDSDLASLVKYAHNPRVANQLRDLFPYPYTAADGKNWLAIAGNRNYGYNFAIGNEMMCIGGIGIHPQFDVHRYSAEIGYWLGEPFWSRGIMTLAVEKMTAFGFEQLKMARIFATVFAYNPSSMRVLEKCGYRREGVMRKYVFKNERFWDAVLYARTDDD